MQNDRIEARWIDAFEHTLRLCKVSAGDEVAILSETQSRQVNPHLAELAILRLGARPFHLCIPTPRQSAPVPVRSTGSSQAIQHLRPVLAALTTCPLVVDCTVEGLMHAAIAWDMPGYGGSDPLEAATIAGFAQALDHFLRQKQIDQPLLVGHSLGGMIVQEFLASYPGRTPAAVLYATSPAFGRRDGTWQQEFIRARLDPLDAGKTMAELAPTIAQGMVGSAAKPAGIALATQSMAATSEASYRATVLSLLDFDRRDNLAKIDIPCLLVTGSEDSNAPAPMMEKMAAKINDAQFVVLPGLGHLAHLEDADVFNHCLRGFLNVLK